MPQTWYKALISIIITILVICLVIFLVIIFSEYFPNDEEVIQTEGTSTKTIKVDDTCNIISYNLGYLSLDNTQDYFMDGGKSVRPASATTVTKNLSAINNFIDSQDADIYLFQDVDTKAKRSYNINEYEGIKEGFDGTSAYAKTSNVLYVPRPLFNSVGHVESGIVTLNKYNVTDTTRISLKSAFKWPRRALMSKSCIMEQRIPIESTDKELVVYNFILDKYGSNEGKEEQLKTLVDAMKTDLDNGNYVIAGGDFSLTLPNVDTDTYPIYESEKYNPVKIDESILPEGLFFSYEPSKPTERLMDEEYTGNYDNSHVYIVDGFIVSSNVEVQSVDTIENNFSYSNHQPVKISIKIK